MSHVCVCARTRASVFCMYVSMHVCVFKYVVNLQVICVSVIMIYFYVGRFISNHFSTYTHTRMFSVLFCNMEKVLFYIPYSLLTRVCVPIGAPPPAYLCVWSHRASGPIPTKSGSLTGEPPSCSRTPPPVTPSGTREERERWGVAKRPKD